MRTAEEFVPGATSGNETMIDIAAPPEVVWAAMHELTFDDLKITRILAAIRSAPTVLRRRGSILKSDHQVTEVLKALQSNRFFELHSEDGRLLTLGVVGQFWRLNGGIDAAIDSPAQFAAFDEPGFVKSAIDFALESTATGTRLSTRTCNIATDPVADRKFRRYWLVVGAGSKAIRIDMLRGIQRLAEADT